jgi:hypothetical protein
MRVLVCGDRKWTDQNLIEGWLSFLLDNHPEGIVVIEGEAPGADVCAREVAKKLRLSFKPFPAKWEIYGNAAGPIRNKKMLVEGKPDLVLAFHDDLVHSRGTKNMIKQADEAGVKVKVVTHKDKLVK